MEFDGVFLKGSATTSGMFWGVCGLGMALGNLSANGLGCIPVLLKICCKAYSTGACWPLGGLVLVLRWRSLGELSSIGIP